MTCCRNGDGFCEPLVGIWSPEALGKLDAAGCEGRGRSKGPSAVVRELGGKQIEVPDGEEWRLKGVNNREEWDEVLRGWKAMLGGN